MFVFFFWLGFVRVHAHDHDEQNNADVRHHIDIDMICMLVSI